MPRDTPGEELAAPPPSNIEVEQALLGSLLINNAAYHRVADVTRAEHFHEPVHARIFEAIRLLCDRGETASPVSLKRYFDSDGALSEIGGASYLAKLAGSVVTVLSVDGYAAELRDLWIRRKLIEEANRLIDAAQAPTLNRDAVQVAEQHAEAVWKITDAGTGEKGGSVSIGDSAEMAIAQAEQAWQNQGRLTGISTGIPDLDEILGGLQDGHLIILAGRPSMGKTSLATGIASAAANAFLMEAFAEKRPPHQVLEFQLEMSHQEVTIRRLAEQTGLSAKNIRAGRLAREDFEELMDARDQLKKLPIRTDDNPRLMATEIRNRARRVQRKGGGVGLVVVDHLGLIRSSKETYRLGETAMVTEITNGLKALAKELSCPVLALSQLNRDLERREDKRPMLADLRSSGSIEQDADVVLFVYREEYYMAREGAPVQRPGEADEAHDKRRRQYHEKLGQVAGKAQIIVAKQRNGPIGTVDCEFDAATVSFRHIGQGRLAI